MNEIRIPFKVNSLSEIVQRQTKNYCFNYLSIINLRVHARDQDVRNSFIKPIKTKLRELTNRNDRVVFISEVLIHLDYLMNEDHEIMEDLDAIELIQDIQHYLVRELERMDVGVDRNAFGNEEIKELNIKIDKIINKLDMISGGQEVIFDRIEELKDDYADLLKSFGLGKKPFYQRFAGIAASYFGEKGADETFNLLRPLIKDVFDSATKLIENS